MCRGNYAVAAQPMWQAKSQIRKETHGTAEQSSTTERARTLYDRLLGPCRQGYQTRAYVKSNASSSWRAETFADHVVSIVLWGKQ